MYYDLESFKDYKNKSTILEKYIFLKKYVEAEKGNATERDLKRLKIVYKRNL